MLLSEAAIGSHHTIRSVDLPEAHRHRLAVMGIRPGATLRVSLSAGVNGRVLAIGADRIALDTAACGRIGVVPAGVG